MGGLSGPEHHLVPEVGEPAPVGVQQPLGVEPVEALGAEVSLGDAVAQNVVRRDEAFPVALAAYGPSTWKGETNPSGFRSTNTAGEKMFVNGAVVRQHQPAGDESGVPPPLVHASEDCRIPQELTAVDAPGLLQ